MGCIYDLGSLLSEFFDNAFYVALGLFMQTLPRLIDENDKILESIRIRGNST